MKSFEAHRQRAARAKDEPSVVSPRPTTAAGRDAVARPIAGGLAFRGQGERAGRDTGLPEGLRAGIERLSGLALDDVRVHHDSPLPARVGALAHTRGRDIHLGPGQDQHLPHEAWHVVQQAQGRVHPTLQLKGTVAVNDDVELEREATAKGAEALRLGRGSARAVRDPQPGGAVASWPDVSVTQLRAMDVETTGVTHLVRLNPQGSLYQEDFVGNEVAEAHPGDIVQVETDNVLRSRRGPNQEADPRRDRDKGPENEWVNALLFNKRQLPKHSYIRAGTFREKSTDAPTTPEPTDGRKASLLLPYEVPVAQGEVYVIDAAHRGDMYQERAALAIRSRPLVVYNFKEENDLTNYLTNSGADIFKLKYNPAMPTDRDFKRGRVYRSVTVLSESDATDIIVERGQDTSGLPEWMATIPPEFDKLIEAAVQLVFKDLPGNNALVMFRDSGQTGLVYPELDSGGALQQIGDVVAQKKLRPVACGAPKDFTGMDSIGPYWEALEHIPKESGIRLPEGNPKLYKRDVEAQFMKIAYRLGKYKLVIGFRSGALDLFTLLGIPTISIGLRGQVGEERHSKYVDDPKWQRTNVQYDIPRNEYTKLVPGRGESHLYMSPYWKMRGTKAPQTGEEQYPTTAPPPGPFHPLDLPTVTAGLETGIAKVIPPEGKQKKSAFNQVFTREEVRSGDQPPAYFASLLTPELAAVADSEELESLRQKQITDMFDKLMTDYADSAPPHQHEAVAKAVEAEKRSFAQYLKIRMAKVRGAKAKEHDAPKSASAPKEAKTLSSKAETVLRVLDENEGRVELKNMKTDEGVGKLFPGIAAKEWQTVYKELVKAKLVKKEEEGRGTKNQKNWLVRQPKDT